MLLLHNAQNGNIKQQNWTDKFKKAWLTTKAVLDNFAIFVPNVNRFVLFLSYWTDSTQNPDSSELGSLLEISTDLNYVMNEKGITEDVKSVSKWIGQCKMSNLISPINLHWNFSYNMQKKSKFIVLHPGHNGWFESAENWQKLFILTLRTI